MKKSCWAGGVLGNVLHAMPLELCLIRALGKEKDENLGKIEKLKGVLVK